MNREPEQIPNDWRIGDVFSPSYGPRVDEPLKTFEINRRLPTSSTTGAGAFYGTYVDEDGDTYLQGGTVSGGDGTETIADIKIIDADTGVLHSAGDHMYVEATGDGIVADGYLVSAWNLSSATLGYNATVPSNTLPLAAGATGKKCYVSLGVFTADAFQPAASGNIGISYCPGSYTVTR